MPKIKVTTETDDMPDELAPDTASEPSLDALMGQILGQGWPEMDSKNIGQLLNKQMKQQQQAMRREAIMFRDCFATESGRKVLNILLDQTLRAVTWPVHAMTDANMMMAHGLWREGQNAFMASIIEAIAIANNQDVKPRSAT
jgi:hypothetical protein